MIDGLRVAPWVAYFKHRQSTKGDRYADEYLDCTACREQHDAEARASMACGWLPADRRTGPPIFRAHGGPETKVCPGYLVTMSVVHEGMRAASWADRGLLELRTRAVDGVVGPLLLDAVDLAHSGLKAAEAEHVRQMTKKG